MIFHFVICFCFIFNKQTVKKKHINCIKAFKASSVVYLFFGFVLARWHSFVPLRVGVDRNNCVRISFAIYSLSAVGTWLMFEHNC